jgi:hypothetical protein
MKLRVMMKNPDALEKAVKAAAGKSHVEQEKLYKLASRWFLWGEILCVEIDTEAETCTVVEDEGNR